MARRAVIAAILLAGCSSPPAQAPQDAPLTGDYLSDWPVAAADEDANFIRSERPTPADLEFPYQRDLNVLKRPLKIRGRLFAKGIGVHARSELTFTTDQRYRRFAATIGIDDEASKVAYESGNVTFEVRGDGRKLYDSGVVTARDPARAIVVDICAVVSLKLVVTFGTDDSGQGDVADWALARVIP